MLTIYGAGAVGLVIGARLARAGEPVLFVTRRPEAAREIAERGVQIEDPATGERWCVRAHAVAGPAAAAPQLGSGPVLFCMRAPDTESAAAALADVAPEADVASVQNDLDNEAILARRFTRVFGVVVRQTCTRVGANRARASGPGRLVLGAHPRGCEDCEPLVERFRRAGFDVGVSSDLRADRWLKLCINLMSAPNALIRREDHARSAFVELKARLLEEARDALGAAGITARSCDGRDRDLDGEIAYQRESLRRGTSARRLPLYNQVWSALRDGGALEADAYHRRIIDVGHAGGVATPINLRVLSALVRAGRESLGPECFGAEEILGSPPA